MSKTLKVIALTALAITAAAFGQYQLAISLGIAAFGAAIAPGAAKSPDPSVSQPLRQSRPPRQSGYGRTKLSGPYLLFDIATTDGTSVDIIAVHAGEADGFERYFLGDDEVTLNGSGWVAGCPKRNDGRYSTSSADKVQILTRRGLPTETAITGVAGSTAPHWGSDYRGDGIAQLALGCRTPLEKYFPTIYPNNLPMPSAVLRCLKVTDPRTGVKAWSDNPAVCLADFLTNGEHGLGLSYARRIAPTVQAWKDAADDCDSVIDGALRYRCGGAFLHTAAPSETIGKLLSSFDGWMGQTFSGALTVYSGRYAAPTVTIGPDIITGYAPQFGVEDENAVTTLIVGYTSPDNDYTQVEADPWRDEDAIAARGEKSAPLDLPWVQSVGQARRLAKRQMTRLSAKMRGSVSTNLGGMEALGHRYVQLRIPELDMPETDDAPAEPFDYPVEITRAEIDLANLSVTFEWILADPNIDDWSSEEIGSAPVVTSPSSPAALSAPVVSSIEVLQPKLNNDIQGIRLRVHIAALNRADAMVTLRWKQGDGVWVYLPDAEAAATGETLISVVGVTAGVTITVQAAYTTGDGRTSPWSADATASTVVASVAYAGPIASTAVVGSETLGALQGRVTSAQSTGSAAATQTAFNALKARVDAAGIP